MLHVHFCIIVSKSPFILPYILPICNLHTTYAQPRYSLYKKYNVPTTWVYNTCKTTYILRTHILPLNYLEKNIFPIYYHNPHPHPREGGGPHTDVYIYVYAYNATFFAIFLLQYKYHLLPYNPPHPPTGVRGRCITVNPAIGIGGGGEAEEGVGKGCMQKGSWKLVIQLYTVIYTIPSTWRPKSSLENGFAHVSIAAVASARRCAARFAAAGPSWAAPLSRRRKASWNDGRGRSCTWIRWIWWDWVLDLVSSVGKHLLTSTN